MGRSTDPILFHADLEVVALQPSVDTWILFPRLPLKQPAGLLLPFSTPLLEKKCHTLTLASIAQLFDPPRLHRLRAWTGLATDDDPMDATDERG